MRRISLVLLPASLSLLLASNAIANRPARAQPTAQDAKPKWNPRAQRVNGLRVTWLRDRKWALPAREANPGAFNILTPETERGDALRLAMMHLETQPLPPNLKNAATRIILAAAASRDAPPIEFDSRDKRSHWVERDWNPMAQYGGDFHNRMTIRGPHGTLRLDAGDRIEIETIRGASTLRRSYSGSTEHEEIERPAATPGLKALDAILDANKAQSP